MNWLSLLDMPGKSHQGPLPAPDAALRELEQRLRQHLVTIAVTIGERHLAKPGSLERMASYIRQVFEGFGLEVNPVSYQIGGEPCHNLEVRIPGPGPELVVGAHYDSIPGCPAANDNGTGVASLLVLTEELARNPAPVGLRMVAFVNEEPPYFQTREMGSWVYARWLKQQKVELAGMICLETLGYYSDEPDSQAYPDMLAQLYPNVGDFLAFASNIESRALLHHLIELFRDHEEFPSQGLVAPGDFPYINWSDHFGFWEEGYPAIMLTDTAPLRYPYYHSPEDTLDKVNFERLARVNRGLLACLRHWDHPTRGSGRG